MSDTTTGPGTKRVDPRVARTRSLLRSAALELAAERELAGITIADVAERATVNRATVYQHYDDRDALLLDAMEDELTGLAGLLARCPLVDRPDTMPEPFLDVFRYIESHLVLYRRMLGPCGSARFLNRLQQLVAEQVARQLPASGAGAHAAAADLRAHCAAGAFIGILRHWLLAPELLSSEVVAPWAWQALTASR
ncbi:TetR/AcrR family transcriptional regulator [Streptomyces shenzhenensis]|uniref:TetR/AcrR family transcriptional regulator n=1 Tax=Streptomyces shenzhenensis TaxID=943815 RepID=UPI0033D19664